MARVLHSNKWFEQVEPSTFSETEIEDRIIVHAPEIYPEYRVLPFKVTVESSVGKAKPDLVFISNDYSEWRVAEVEMGYHDYNSHVEPQVEILADALYGLKEAKYICDKDPSLNREAVAALFANKPGQVLVIVNEPKPDWVTRLRRYNALLAVFELFRADDETELIRVNGEYPTLLVDKISDCSCHPYTARFLQIHRPDAFELPPPRGRLKLRFNNCVTEWTRTDADGKVWLVPTGRNPLNPLHKYLIYRQSDASLVLARR